MLKIFFAKVNHKIGLAFHTPNVIFDGRRIMKTKAVGIFLVVALLVLSVVMPVHADVIWTEYNDNPIFGQGTSVSGPKAYYCKVIYDANSFSGHGAAFPYKMWYGTSSGQTGLAYSNDGINWINPDPVMTNGYHAQVIYDAGGFGGATYYKMWYWAGLSYSPGDIHYAESVDGVTWINDQPLKNGAVVPILGVPFPHGIRGVMARVQFSIILQRQIPEQIPSTIPIPCTTMERPVEVRARA